MNAKPFTLSVVVATIVGGVSLVSAQIDRQAEAAASRPVPAKMAARDPSVPLSVASPLDIDPRRMEAPAIEPAHATAATSETGGRALRVSSAF